MNLSDALQYLSLYVDIHKPVSPYGETLNTLLRKVHEKAFDEGVDSVEPEEDYDDVWESGYQAGYDEGFEQGYDDGYETCKEDHDL